MDDKAHSELIVAFVILREWNDRKDLTGSILGSLRHSVPQDDRGVRKTSGSSSPASAKPLALSRQA